MPNYAIRIELTGTPSGEVYDLLHDVMYAANIYRIIRSDDGRWFRLPNATYVCEWDAEPEWVRTQTLAKVRAIWASAEIIVFRFDEAAWELELLPQSKALPA